RLHPSRRHFQQQVGCSLRGQRNVSLARLRPRQQEEDHDSGCRRVPALLPTASWLGTHARSGGIAIYGPAALALELSGLRRNHARRRTALCRATPAPLSTSTRPVRSMNLYPHPRFLIVLRHPRRVLVSSGQECPLSQLPSLSPTPQ